MTVVYKYFVIAAKPLEIGSYNKTNILIKQMKTFLKSISTMFFLNRDMRDANNAKFQACASPPARRRRVRAHNNGDLDLGATRAVNS